MQFPLNGSDVFSGIYGVNFSWKHKDVMKQGLLKTPIILRLTPLYGQDSTKTQLSSSIKKVFDMFTWKENGNQKRLKKAFEFGDSPALDSWQPAHPPTPV